MQLTKKQKEDLKRELIFCLNKDKEIVKIVLFGSFVNSDNPKDMDIAVFQDSNEGYLPLSMKYRKRTRVISKKIPLDIFPVKSQVNTDTFLSEIAKGVVIYER